MLQNVYGIKHFQSSLPAIAKKISQVGGHYIVTKRSEPSFVAIPFEDYKEIQDILLELNSPELKQDIADARAEYHRGESSDFESFLDELT